MRAKVSSWREIVLTVIRQRAFPGGSSFARTTRRDIGGAGNAIEQPRSNGQIEISRLKTGKHAIRPGRR
ncbi:hypothetical protein BHMPCIPO_06354 [Ensifer sesbaniae]|nr:hypothetical protein [Ensifer sesbaniae]